MAITHTETITLIEVLTANDDNIVSKVIINTNSRDDSNPSKYHSSDRESFNISTTGITTSTSGFVVYEDLTESIIKGWISTPLANSKVKENNEKIITRLIASDNPTSKDKALPW
tara:strand:- start:197 stop:538 length:342 start_codon:yes stop_codon:yes gene_type:complete